jgi:cytochrome P450
MFDKRQQHLKFTRDRVDARMKRKTDQPDIWKLVMQGSEMDEKALISPELYNNASLFMIAGTETTATLLSGATYLLLQNPTRLARLTKEIRDTFKTFDDINLTTLSQLPYLTACLDEALRMYPPVAGGLRRVVPPEGATVCGRYLPGGVSIVFG